MSWARIRLWTRCFFSSYRRLEDSLAAERTAYISELSRQLVDRHNKMQDQLFQETRL